jgi:ABC-type transport system substrate-binding protein
MIRRFTSAQFVPANAGAKAKNPVGSALFSTPMVALLRHPGHKILRTCCHESARKRLKDHVREIEIVDPLVVRFHLKAPWPDFMTFCGTTASAAGIIVPKNYLTQVGDDGFKKHPIGAGPYKFVGTSRVSRSSWRPLPATSDACRTRRHR